MKDWTTTTPGSLISKFELLVEGNPAASAAGTATSAGATAAGTHTVAVRAVHQSGKSTTSAALKVVAETTAPTFTTATTSSNRTAASGTAATWSMRAYDYAGNYRTSSPPFTRHQRPSDCHHGRPGVHQVTAHTVLIEQPHTQTSSAQGEPWADPYTGCPHVRER
ncbi:hypothetical protein [Streptomyces sp. NPDC001340]